MQIRPAIDIIDGKCVRLTKGDYDTKKIYNEDPLEVAKQFEAAGLTHLHLVDLDGAIANEIVNAPVLESIAINTNLIIDFGGGLKTNEDVKIAFESGATQVTGGSIAVDKEEVFFEWIEKYGSEKVILGADVREDVIAIHGWTKDTALNLYEYIDAYLQKGINYVACTDISKDGMLNGPSLEKYKTIIDRFSEVKLIASGGIATLEDVLKCQEIGAHSTIIGKAIYEGKISLAELAEINNN
jgi:phosphoribosylformimino-5-aminoimidazole carboxamide ribotide isomerase